MSCRTFAKDKNIPENIASASNDLKVVAFLCNWCSYAASDKAGVNQLSIPHQLSIIRVNCSGRVEPTMIMSAFRDGADGVMLLACHPGDCHYKGGNMRAKCRASLLSGLLLELGVDRERFLFDYVSAAESDKFSEITSKFVQKLSQLL